MSSGAAMVPSPLHYIIFHPERKGYEASGEAVVAGSYQANWHGIVWTDPYRRKAGSNEDPFVWDSHEWLYSFCHASQLRRRPSPTEPHVMAGSHIFFCETPAARQGKLKVDTVLVVSGPEAWVSRGKTVPNRYAHHQTSGLSDVWLRHLRHGIPTSPGKGHAGEYTYVANLDGSSYLPMNQGGLPVSVDFAGVLPSRCKDLEKAVPKAQSTYPVMLNAAECAALSAAVIKAAHTRVFRLTCQKPIVLPAKRQSHIAAGVGAP
jgi:hypothetical protein